jgi:hypothetical protein
MPRNRKENRNTDKKAALAKAAAAAAAAGEAGGAGGAGGTGAPFDVAIVVSSKNTPSADAIIIASMADETLQVSSLAELLPMVTTSQGELRVDQYSNFDHLRKCHNQKVIIVLDRLEMVDHHQPGLYAEVAAVVVVGEFDGRLFNQFLGSPQYLCEGGKIDNVRHSPNLGESVNAMYLASIPGHCLYTAEKVVELIGDANELPLAAHEFLAAACRALTHKHMRRLIGDILVALVQANGESDDEVDPFIRILKLAAENPKLYHTELALIGRSVVSSRAKSKHCARDLGRIATAIAVYQRGTYGLHLMESTEQIDSPDHLLKLAIRHAQTERAKGFDVRVLFSNGALIVGAAPRICDGVTAMGETPADQIEARMVGEVVGAVGAGGAGGVNTGAIMLPMPAPGSAQTYPVTNVAPDADPNEIVNMLVSVILQRCKDTQTNPLDVALKLASAINFADMSYLLPSGHTRGELANYVIRVVFRLLEMDPDTMGKACSFLTFPKRQTGKMAAPIYQIIEAFVRNHAFKGDRQLTILLYNVYVGERAAFEAEQRASDEEVERRNCDRLLAKLAGVHGKCTWDGGRWIVKSSTTPITLQELLCSSSCYVQCDDCTCGGQRYKLCPHDKGTNHGRGNPKVCYNPACGKYHPEDLKRFLGSANGDGYYFDGGLVDYKDAKVVGLVPFSASNPSATTFRMFATDSTIECAVTGKWREQLMAAWKAGLSELPVNDTENPHSKFFTSRGVNDPDTADQFQMAAFCEKVLGIAFPLIRAGFPIERIFRLLVVADLCASVEEFMEMVSAKPAIAPVQCSIGATGCLDHAGWAADGVSLCKNGHNCCAQCAVLFTEISEEPGCRIAGGKFRCPICRVALTDDALSALSAPVVALVREDKPLAVCLDCNEVFVAPPSDVGCGGAVETNLRCVPCCDKAARVALEAAMSGEDVLVKNAEDAATDKRVLRICPHCRSQTEKSEGCDRIHCRGCGKYWCWHCGLGAETSGEVYEHMHKAYKDVPDDGEEHSVYYLNWLVENVDPELRPFENLET